MKFPVAIAFGWSGCDNSLLSLSIRWFTRKGWAPKPLAQWSHMFMVFSFQDSENVIHEALGSSGWTEKPTSKLAKWVERDPEHNHAAVEWLEGIPSHVVAQIWAESKSWIGIRSYAHQQIGMLALAESLGGRALRKVLPSIFNRDMADDRVICSEGVGMLVGAHWPALDLRREGEQWATLSPQEWWERYQAHIAAIRDNLESGDH